MKKLFMLLVTALFVVSFASMGFAADAPQKGTIKAIDAKAGTMVFCPAGTKDEIKLKADKASLERFKAGDKVKVTYSGDTAQNIQKDRPGMKVPVGC